MVFKTHAYSERDPTADDIDALRAVNPKVWKFECSILLEAAEEDRDDSGGFDQIILQHYFKNGTLYPVNSTAQQI